MDLSTVAADYGSHMFKLKETFQETDIKGNNDLFNSIKTDSNSNHGHDSSSLFQVKSASANIVLDNSLFSYSSFKKAMDLRTFNRMSEVDLKRTIFEDAELFAKSYHYKLLPITFEQVDETIIQSEHNYSLCSLSSESEPEEDCSRTMDYKQIKEKNYKRRRTKLSEEEEEELMDGKIFEVSSLFEENKKPTIEPQERDASPGPPTQNPSLVQPLDLSAASLVQENKTETLHQADIDEIENDEVAQLDSDKENINGIRVTITRPDEKESYQPCDLFLNDMARLVPWLIDKDCFEIDILDRTCDRRDETRKNRVYYVISEATWCLFQKTNERVILTNDSSLGPPARKVDNDERPSFLVFDQFSLAKCLAEYCHEIGGCFEYTCFEGKDEEEEEKESLIREKEEKILEEIENGMLKKTLKRKEDKTEEEIIADVKENVIEEKNIQSEENQKEQEITKEKENLTEQNIIQRKEDKKEHEIAKENENVAEDKLSQKKEDKKKQEVAKKMDIMTEEKIFQKKEDKKEQEIAKEKENMINEEITKEKKKNYEIEEDMKGKKSEIIKHVSSQIKNEGTMKKIKKTKTTDTVKIEKPQPEVYKTQNKTCEQKHETKIPRKDFSKHPPEEPEPKKTRRSQHSTSKPETSHKSDKPVIGKVKRKCQSLSKEEPSRKREKPAESEEFIRKTRSRKPLEDSKIIKPKEKKQSIVKQKENKKDVTVEKIVVTRVLRSHKGVKTKEEMSSVKTKMKIKRSRKR